MPVTRSIILPLRLRQHPKIREQHREKDAHTDFYANRVFSFLHPAHGDGYCGQSKAPITEVRL